MVMFHLLLVFLTLVVFGSIVSNVVQPTNSSVFTPVTLTPSSSGTYNTYIFTTTSSFVSQSSFQLGENQTTTRLLSTIVVGSTNESPPRINKQVLNQSTVLTSLTKMASVVASSHSPEIFTTAIHLLNITKYKATNLNKRNLTLFYATIFSVVGFVVIVIVIVIIIGCRNSNFRNPIERNFELDRLSTNASSSKGVAGMYGREEKSAGRSTSCEGKFPTNNEEPVWDIPKLEFINVGAVDSNGGSKKNEETGGIVNIALDSDEKNDFY